MGFPLCAPLVHRLRTRAASRDPSPGIRQGHLLTTRELLAPSPAADAVSMHIEEAPSPGPDVRATIAVRARLDGTAANAPKTHGHHTWTAPRGLSRRVLAL